ncbi:MAG: GntR family transcriptional regulator [Pseudohongiellaceae bacterium]
MQINWNDKEPIYLQLRDRLVELILDEVLHEGESLPSVRQVASEQRINPITVSKAFQMMVDEGLVEKRRGLGMYVVTGARAKLRSDEKQKFLSEEWPAIMERIARLDLDMDQLIRGTKAVSGKTDGKSK